jgi:Acyl-CoA thioesterase C-terminal domain/Acyl-CoA thioesterase N-terminal domain
VVGAEARRAAGAALSDSVFRRDGDAFVPTGHARGPWDPGQLHGGAPGALIAEAVQADGYLVARLTIDFLAPVPMAPLTIRAQTTKPGRNLQMAEAEMEAEGRTVLRARAVRLRRGQVELPAEAGSANAVGGGPAAGGGGAPATGGPAAAAPGPDAGRPGRFPLDDGTGEGFHRTAMDIRFVAGDYGIGPAKAWFRMNLPLIDDTPPSPLARAIAAADFGNGISRVVDFTDYLFVNTDLTVHLHREPATEWVLVDARTRLEPHGAGLAHSILSDERGQLGLAAQSLFVASRPQDS